MALIKCSECGKDVSDKATACPFCGNPLTEQITTVQLTNKKWKKYQLASAAFFFVGLFMIFKGGGYLGVGIALWFVGFVLLMISRFGAWWTNR